MKNRERTIAVSILILIAAAILTWYIDPPLQLQRPTRIGDTSPIKRFTEDVERHAISVGFADYHHKQQSWDSFTVSSLLSSGGDYAQPKACLQNIMVKLVAASGDLDWNSWQPEGGKIPPPEPTTNGVLSEGVKEICAILPKRVYAVVDRKFTRVLEDERRFTKDEFMMDDHKTGLRAFIGERAIGTEQVRFESWRENRRRGALQCVIARRVGGNVHFVDIDIDKSHPWADAFSIFGHLIQMITGTNHVGLQKKQYFRKQNDYEVDRYLQWIEGYR